MPPPRTRLVRRAPLLERIKAQLSPLDFLLWLSEELNANEYEETVNQWAVPLGVALNVLFMIARANSGSKEEFSGDVFGDEHIRKGSGWLAWFASFVVHLLTFLSFSNGLYTFWRKRHYRLFESSIEKVPNTSSVQRVRVDSSPISSSPLRYFTSILSSPSAESRAYPDASQDVWELNVWDPTPLCLRVFCLFSPGHVVVYWLFLPLAPLDPRPSVTVAKTLALAALLSLQLTFLQTSYDQQAKDNMIVHQEVQNEYDTKFVRPMIHRPVRDAGTQSFSQKKGAGLFPDVLTYTPKTYVNRGFQTNPNTNYATHYDPHGVDSGQGQSMRAARSVITPNFQTPRTHGATGFSSPIPDSMASSVSRHRYPQNDRRDSDGGSLGAYSHAYSPYKRSSMTPNASRTRMSHTPDVGPARNPVKREGSPLKRLSTPGGRNFER